MPAELKLTAPHVADGTQTQSNTPRTALQFVGSPFTFAKPASPEPLSPRQFSMLARTADAIEHWYWGKIIHDMAGFKQAKPKVVVDWCHNDNLILGFVDEFKADKDGLTLTGQLTPAFPEDRSVEVIKKHDAGVPYEASIDWTGPARIEFVPEGMSVVVNDRDFVGPGYVVREWSIQAVAICPHGADGATTTEMTRDPNTIAVVTLFSSQLKSEPKSKPMSQTTPAAATQLGGTPSNQNDPIAAVKADIARFTKRFGAENGLRHFHAGTTYESALETEFDAAKAEHEKQLKAKDDEIAELKKKLAAAPRGEKNPLTFSTPEETSNTAPKTPGAGMSQFIRLPNAAAAAK